MSFTLGAATTGACAGGDGVFGVVGAPGGGVFAVITFPTVSIAARSPVISREFAMALAAANPDMPLMSAVPYFSPSPIIAATCACCSGVPIACADRSPFDAGGGAGVTGVFGAMPIRL